MKTAVWLLGGLLSIFFSGIAFAQPNSGGVKSQIDASSSAPPAGTTVFQKVEPAKPPETSVETKPPVVNTDGTAAIVDEVPKSVVVKETQPTGAAVPPPDNQPKLSSPVPPPETIGIVPQVRYFVMIFGSESVPKRARFTHTWYTIVKATPKQNLPTDYDPNGHQVKYYDLTAHTISWLPASMNIRVLKLRPDVGKNIGLHETIRFARCNGEVVGMWGPYEVNPLVAADLYDRSVKQIKRLNSGAVLYKAIDPDRAPASLRICDCIHAVSDMDGPGRRSEYDEMQRYGLEASRHVAAVMIRANRLDGSTSHEWVAEALDLDRYPIRRQAIGNCLPVQSQSAATANGTPASTTKR